MDITKVFATAVGFSAVFFSSFTCHILFNFFLVLMVTYICIRAINSCSPRASVNGHREILAFVGAIKEQIVLLTFCTIWSSQFTVK